MPPKRTAKGRSKHAIKAKKDTFGAPPGPFKTAPDGLEPFFDELSPRHCYIVHVDYKPASFKRKIFSVPVLMNILVAAAFVLRLWYIGPYYLKLFETALGTPNDLTLSAKDLPWKELVKVVGVRGFTFMLDLCLVVFVWPWPYEFVVGSKSGSPVRWRAAIGFRDKEIYVRRSRAWYTTARRGATPKSKVDVLTDPDARKTVLNHVAQATAPQLIQDKTGYLTMDAQWDLDWDLMVWATALVDNKDLALEAFNTLVLLHHSEYGWVIVDSEALASFHNGGSVGGPASPADDARRQQIFAFRDALEAIGKDDLFYRWIEIIQYESTKPGGLGDQERQAKVAKQVRDLFQSEGVDFDALWKESVGTDGSEGLAGM